MSEKQPFENDEAVYSVLKTALKIPYVKVNRDSFLVSVFDKKDYDVKDDILRDGPVDAGISREELRKIASSLVLDRTVKSSGVSLFAGLPGGLAMTMSIPGDTIQFFAVALRLAQEIAYLYGEKEMWDDQTISEEDVMKNLLVYFGVMLGVSGASATLKVLASALGKQALKKIPKIALTKTFYYPIIKSVVKFFGVKMTKESFGKIVSKVIPVVGGVLSGGITFVSMRPMGMRLVNTFDEAKFNYTQEDLESDLMIIDGMTSQESDEFVVDDEKTSSIAEEIEKCKQLVDQNILTEEEFLEIKRRLIEKM